jgi:hypothetical protein
MQVWAVIVSGVVINVVTAVEETALIGAPEGASAVRIDTVSPVPGIGWSYDGEDFAEPAP